MKIPKPVIALAVAAAAGAAVWMFWPKGRGHTLSGYIEGDLLYLSAPVSGAVTDLRVEKGQRVAAGAPLFQIDPRAAAAQKSEAQSALVVSEAQVNDAMKGERAQELAVIEAQRREAAARLTQAKNDFERVRILTAKGWYAQARLDQARAAYQSVEAQVTEQTKRLDAAGLGQRPDQIAAARARATQAAGSMAEADTRLSQLAPAAPKDARVQDVFFQRGEWAPANQPVVALLPDDRVKLRFFVPETEVARYRPGRTVRFTCDGCASGLSARIVYVSPTAEFTPPVIYSRESRAKLVFLVEALPEKPGTLAPGLPADVERLAPEGR